MKFWLKSQLIGLSVLFFVPTHVNALPYSIAINNENNIVVSYGGKSVDQVEADSIIGCNQINKPGCTILKSGNANYVSINKSLEKIKGREQFTADYVTAEDSNTSYVNARKKALQKCNSYTKNCASYKEFDFLNMIQFIFYDSTYNLKREAKPTVLKYELK